jgi:ribosomal protein L7/L12
MSKNIPKPIIRIGHSTKKNGTISFDIDGNKIKNMSVSQFTELISALGVVRRKLVFLRDKESNNEVLTEKQYDEIVKLVKDNKSLGAVKLYKEYADVGLKDAKTFVDNLRIYI